ncbi:MAG: hypothetical protein Q4E47_03680 [Candidatus Saccharibacteria bacterium]|nr:hypothetical protein [Candidatus Saccharibacteria bacterium]
MKHYVGDRKHLQPLIDGLWCVNGGEPYAKILSGSSTEENLGYLSKNAAKLFDLPAKSAIKIKRSYLLHMDNSGHFTGKGYGKYGHHDLRYLNIKEIIDIVKYIKNAEKSRIIIREKRGAFRYNILTRSVRNTIISVEKNKNHLTLVTAYNPDKRTLGKIRDELAKQKSHKGTL